MSKGVDKRKFSRSQVAVRVEVRLHCGVLIEGRACNVSLNGLFFESEQSLPLGSRVRVKIMVDGVLGEAHIECAGIVSRLDERGVAIELDQIAAESIERLRHLIRHHANDAAKAEDEFAAQPPPAVLEIPSETHTDKKE